VGFRTITVRDFRGVSLALYLGLYLLYATAAAIRPIIKPATPAPIYPDVFEAASAELIGACDTLVTGPLVCSRLLYDAVAND